MKFENVEIDARAMQLRVDGELVTTTATEFRLLDYLARHPGRVFSRDHLLDAVWGDARFVTPRSVDVYVRRIREKIEADAETPRYLKTMRGAGYRFEIPKTPQAGRRAGRARRSSAVKRMFCAWQSFLHASGSSADDRAGVVAVMRAVASAPCGWIPGDRCWSSRWAA